MINLTNTSFIIPLYIESEDRLKNAKSVLGFLNKNFITNVLIHEVYEKNSKLNFIDKFNNLNITHLSQEKNSEVYHRTKYLNKLLSLVKTKVVCNYDIDVILPVRSYVVSEYLIDNNLYDVVYPYGFGDYQMQVSKDFTRTNFNKNFDISSINKDYLYNERSEYGHCIFFKTDSYKSFGAENENFISYGPEDSERYFRAVNFGMNIHRIKDFVYHFEHERTSNSNKQNLHYVDNQELFDKIKKMSQSDILEYYSNLDYVKDYKFDIKLLKPDFNKNIDDSNFIKENFENNFLQENVQIVFNNIQSTPVNRNVCTCGEPINKIKYNYCQKCNRMY